ncbi:MAG: VOC family protein [Armatimonadetes bacterium]|nr:VOC family protein [Armatimonadota bacterium]
MPMPVGKEDVARAFYGDFLGLTWVDKPVHLAAMGGAWFAFPDGRHVHLQAEPNFAPFVHPHPAIAVRDLDALAAQFVERGVTPRWDTRWEGVRRFYAIDPFGNRLEFVDAGDVGL